MSFKKKPAYKKEKIEDTAIQVMNGIEFVSTADYKEKYRYTVYNADKEKAGYSIYSLDDEIWISAYTDNTDNNTELIQYIYQLK